MRQHHARGGTLDEMIAFVGQLPANDTQMMLEVAGAEAVRQRAVELQRMAPAVLDPTYAVLEGVGHGMHEERPDAFIASLVRFVAAASVQA